MEKKQKLFLIASFSSSFKGRK